MTTAAHLPHSATLLQDAVFRQRTRRQRPLSSRVGCFDARIRSCGPNASPDGCSTPTLGHSGAGVESFRSRVSGDNGCDGSPFIYHSGEGVRCLAVADDFTDGAKHAQSRSTTGDRLTLVYSKSVTARRGKCVVMMGGPVDSTMDRGCFFRLSSSQRHLLVPSRNLALVENHDRYPRAGTSYFGRGPRGVGPSGSRGSRTAASSLGRGSLPASPSPDRESRSDVAVYRSSLYAALAFP